MKLTCSNRNIRSHLPSSRRSSTVPQTRGPPRKRRRKRRPPNNLRKLRPQHEKLDSFQGKFGDRWKISNCTENASHFLSSCRTAVRMFGIKGTSSIWSNVFLVLSFFIHNSFFPTDFFIGTWIFVLNFEIWFYYLLMKRKRLLCRNSE